MLAEIHLSQFYRFIDLKKMNKLLAYSHLLGHNIQNLTQDTHTHPYPQKIFTSSPCRTSECLSWVSSSSLLVPIAPASLSWYLQRISLIFFGFSATVNQTYSTNKISTLQSLTIFNKYIVRSSTSCYENEWPKDCYRLQHLTWSNAMKYISAI